MFCFPTVGIICLKITLLAFKLPALLMLKLVNVMLLKLTLQFKINFEPLPFKIVLPAPAPLNEIFENVLPFSKTYSPPAR